MVMLLQALLDRPQRDKIFFMFYTECSLLIFNDDFFLSSTSSDFIFWGAGGVGGSSKKLWGNLTLPALRRLVEKKKLHSEPTRCRDQHR